MNSSYRITKHDMALLPRIFKFTAPEDIPLQFKLGDRAIRGIPAEFCPTVTHRLIDCNMVQYVIEGQNADGLSILAEYLEYTNWIYIGIRQTLLYFIILVELPRRKISWFCVRPFKNLY